jgi:hypothetical protein
MRVTCPAHLIFLDFIVLTVFSEKYNFLPSPCADDGVVSSAQTAAIRQHVVQQRLCTYNIFVLWSGDET